MSSSAYHLNDPEKKLISIDEWVKKYSPNTVGGCRVCHEQMTIRGARSQQKTHFTHKPNSSCPTIVKNHRPYDVLRDVERDPTLASFAKQWAIDNLESIHYKVKKYVPGLTWKEFHQLLTVANEVDIWSLKSLSHDYIPYLLLTCTDKFEKNKYGRKYDCFFVLETSPTTGGVLWNDTTEGKKYIWQVNITSTREVTHHEISLDTPLPWYTAQCLELLK
ncbi:hypothetical protein AB4562_03900 [Vibrio sp. 10N.222.54.A1]